MKLNNNNNFKKLKITRMSVFPKLCPEETGLYFLLLNSQFSSVQSLSRVRLFVTPWTVASQASLSIPNSCPLSRWCHPTISSSVVPFSSRLQSFPASESFPMSQSFASGGLSTGASSSASVLPVNILGWFPLGWTGWISLLSKGLSRDQWKQQSFLKMFLFTFCLKEKRQHIFLSKLFLRV